MQNKNYILPAEWHRQSCVQLTWPHEDTDWLPYLDDITETFVQIAKAVAHYEPLVIAAKHPDAVRAELEESLSDEEMENVRIYECDNNDTWARDHAFITLIPTAEGSGIHIGGAAVSAAPTEQTVRDYGLIVPIHLLDFRFNGWGEKFAADKDNLINRTLHARGVFAGERVDYDDFVLEGGSIESDGRGTVLTTSVCLMAPNRNQPLSQAEVEQVLKERLCARKIVWFDHGQLIGDDTDGHIDTIVRVAPHDTLLYVGCDDAEDEQYEDFQALEKQLQKLFTYEGYPYRLLKLPMPDAIYDEGDRLTTDRNSKGDRLPATYANFLILNGAVIYPTYNQPEKDEEAKRQIQLAFPDRNVIGVDSLTIIRQHGSIHCLTMQLPKGAIK